MFASSGWAEGGSILVPMPGSGCAVGRGGVSHDGWSGGSGEAPAESMSCPGITTGRGGVRSEGWGEGASEGRGNSSGLGHGVGLGTRHVWNISCGRGWGCGWGSAYNG